MTKGLTDTQRTAMATMRAASAAGLTLSSYSSAQGLNVREVYDAIAALRRSGVLPPTNKPRPRKSAFVAPSEAPKPSRTTM